MTTHFHRSKKVFLFFACGLFIWLSMTAQPAAAQSVVLTVDRGDENPLCGGTCAGFCSDANSNDCSIITAITIANNNGVPTSITFADDYTIVLTSDDLPTITGNDVDIQSGPSGRVTIDGQNVTDGFRIDGDNVTLNDLSLIDFSGKSIYVSASATNARISNSSLTGPNCSPTVTGSAVGVFVTGSVSSSETKAHIWRNNICGMGNAAIRIENTNKVYIGRNPGTQPISTNKNNIFWNALGIYTTNVCDIYEDYSNIHDNRDGGMRISVSPQCRKAVFYQSTVIDNGGAGYLVERDHQDFSYVRIIPEQVEDNAGLPIALNHGFGVGKPTLISYNASSNTLLVGGVFGARRIHIYQTSSDHGENGGGGSYIDSIIVGGISGSTTVNYNLDLDDYPGLTPTTTGVITDKYNETHPTGGENRSSEMSDRFVPDTTPLAVGLQQQHTLSQRTPSQRGAVLSLSLVLLLLTSMQITRRVMLRQHAPD